MLRSTGGETPFRPVPDWEQIPDGFAHLDVVDVTVDDDDQVYVLTRKDPRLIIYDAEGRLVRTWGADFWSARPHSLTLAPYQDAVYVVDELRHLIAKYDLFGKLLQVIGTGKASETGHTEEVGPIHQRLLTIQQSAEPFNLPTALAVGANGDLYVTDGYGNARVHRFREDGTLVGSWGDPGSGPGQFCLPHAILALDDGRLLVADRENERIQVFDLDGRFIEQWTDLQRPTALTEDRDRNILVAEMTWLPGERSMRDLDITAPRPARLAVLDRRGHVIERWPETGDGLGPGQIIAPHGLAVDSHGAVYLAEVSHTYATVRGLDPDRYQSLQKLTRTTN